MRANTHYAPTENGYSISASPEIFNRTLYGSHKNDYKSERFFTFAGDAPLFMGAVTDWQKVLYGEYAKCGILTSGLALTPGNRIKFYYSEDMDLTSRWFHNSEDVVSEFKNGWMEYELSQISSWFPDVRVKIEAYPLLPDDGFLINYNISTDQRVIFTAGFGGVTDGLGRFEYKDIQLRNFTPDNCKGNVITLGKNRASIKHSSGHEMLVATSFPADFSLGSAKAMADHFAGVFLGSEPENEDDAVVKISSVIEPNETLSGYIIVLHKSDEKTLNKWLSMENPISYIKQEIYKKHACISVKTNDAPLDLTIAPTVIALDASWHENSFHHGAFGYHAPYLGWRNWYGPTALGWHDRVEKTMEAHLGQLSRGPVSEERIYRDRTPRPADKRYHPSQYGTKENSPGYMLHMLTPPEGDFGGYTMQECAFDMMLYSIEWTGNFELAKKHFDDFCLMLDWEERVLDSDNDGLYENFLNTWISDGHSYNGAGCAQSSSYNYRANMVMAKIADKIGKDSKIFRNRAEKIKRAVNEKLWIAEQGIIAESIDTIGNCLIHPCPELSTIYLAIDCGIVDDFKAYTMLKYTENHIKSIVTPGTDGRLSFSSNWLPKQYSNCGIFPAENAHLALMYYKIGLKEKAKKILDGIVDCYFTGKNPGMAPHIQSARCTSDFADLDFTDVTSTYLRLITEGLFGIKVNAVDELITIAPSFPDDWNDASLSLKDISLYYSKKGDEEVFDIYCDREEKKYVKLPMHSSNVDVALLDGEPISYEILSTPGGSFMLFEIEKQGKFQLRVVHGNGKVPTAHYADTVLSGNEIVFEIKDGQFVEFLDISNCLENISVVGNKVYAKAKNIPGHHTFFLRAKSGEYDGFIPADFEIVAKDVLEKPLIEKPFEPVDISEFFNCSLTDIHNQDFLNPRPDSYSIGLFQNGRYCANWNHYASKRVFVDDSLLRNAGGIIKSPAGIPFITPKENENVACVSIWENFPTDITIPLKGAGQEIAIMFVSSSHPLQSHVDNFRITVTYADGTYADIPLMYPSDVDDWLTSALQTKGENFYFSRFNHATVRKIRIDPEKELASIKIEAIANEVIMGIVGLSISR